MSNPKSAAWYSGGLDMALQAGSNRGNVYYVNGTDWGDGADTNSGLRPDDPFLTLTHAIGECTDEMFDTIVVVDYWTPTGETWPIAVDKAQVTIVGAPGGSFNRWPCVHPAGDTAAFDLQAAGIRLIDLYIDAGASHAGVEFSGGGERNGIYGCYFATGTHGVLGIAGSPSFGFQVSGCTFTSLLTAGGIYLNNPPFTRISDNVFCGVQGVAIEILQSAEVQILDNRIACDSDVQGRGITLGAVCTRCLVAGNSAYYGNAAGMVQNPFLDSAGAAANDWMNNMWGITLAHPA